MRLLLLLPLVLLSAANAIQPTGTGINRRAIDLDDTQRVENSVSGFEVRTSTHKKPSHPKRTATTDIHPPIIQPMGTSINRREINLEDTQRVENSVSGFEIVTSTHKHPSRDESTATGVHPPIIQPTATGFKRAIDLDDTQRVENSVSGFEIQISTRKKHPREEPSATCTKQTNVHPPIVQPTATGFKHRRGIDLDDTQRVENSVSGFEIITSTRKKHPRGKAAPKTLAKVVGWS